ncbi:MAG: hypothetical protein HY973_04535 [Candidatus Kerfeldbacteria bacterium]|nr:hypothetical protein [Candidatus Kerfeldbacteria bacterium]
MVRIFDKKLEKRIEYIEEKLPGKPKVIKRIERIEKKIDKVLVKLLLRDIERQKGKHINQRAYDLIKEDINWLLNNNL